jgi:DNA topoisomerase I
LGRKTELKQGVINVAKNLVIVESPAKANTIKKILGKDYEITASFGHLRDLPKTKIGVDVENNFEPTYITIKGKGDITKKLKEMAKKADHVYLASDMDREGEAIACHLYKILNLKEELVRIEFNEITTTAIQEAVKNPRKLDINRFDAQQARRILDRLTGYKISPLLWETVTGNTSAGRVQSVALKLVCDLEDEIKNFVPQKYWEVKGNFEKKMALSIYKVANEKVSRIIEKEVVNELENKVNGENFEVIESKISKKNQAPPLPLKTSTLQQLASSYLGFSPSRTMKIAQTLYEGVNVRGDYSGLITYMRTDSTRISDDARKQSEIFIESTYGKEYIGKVKTIKKKEGVQDAHEAIRPTDLFMTPDSIKGDLTAEQYKLYKLIWERFLISQFADMKYEQLEVIAEYDKYQFRGTLNKVTFEGYYKIFKDEDEIKTDKFPDINQGDKLKLLKLDIKEGETKPPSRFSEASLIRKLEAEGIGRPSTYATIVETLKKREYVKVEKKNFIPTYLGYEIKEKLEKHFPNIMNVKFTAEMEKKLDEVEAGKVKWVGVLKEFYDDLKKYLIVFEKELDKIKGVTVYSDVICEKCSSKTVLKTGRFGKFLECENEECKTKKSLKNIPFSLDAIENNEIKLKEIIAKVGDPDTGKPTDYSCPACGKKMAIKRGRFGDYLECPDYPECKTRESIPKGIDFDRTEEEVKLNEAISVIKAAEQQIVDEAGKCEKCGSSFSVKMGRFGKFLACNGYPECKNIKKIAKKK